MKIHSILGASILLLSGQVGAVIQGGAPISGVYSSSAVYKFDVGAIQDNWQIISTEVLIDFDSTDVRW